MKLLFKMNLLSKSKQKKIGNELNHFISSAPIIMMLMFFYIGAVPGYFGVNDEMVNPSNISQSINVSAELVKEVLLDVAFTLHDVGAENPPLWFWFWWAVVAYLMIYPLGKAIYYLFSPEDEEEKEEEVKEE